MKLTTSILSFAVITALSLSGCGGDSSSDTTTDSNLDNTKLSGNLGTSYAFYKAPWYRSLFATPAYAAGFGQVKKAVAIPLADGYVLMENAKEVTINSDGTFSVALDRQVTDPDNGQKVDLNWIIILEKTDGTYNFLSIPNNDGSDSLVNLPIAKTTADIDLGDIDNSSDEGRSSKKLDDIASKVTYDINQLTVLSKTDDVVKAVINQYRNNLGKDENEIITVRLTVIGEGNFTKMATEYSKASTYRGYTINIQAGSATVLQQNKDAICDNSKQIEIDLPTGKSISFVGDSTYTSLVSAGGSWNGTSCSGGNTLFQEQTNDDGSLSLNFGGGYTVVNSTTVPKGDWTLKFDGQELGKYDLSYSLPAENGTMKLPVPAVKLDLDPNDNNKTKGFYIKWYIGDIEIPNEIISTIIPKPMLYTQANSGLAITCKDAMHDSNGALRSYIPISECKENDSTPSARYYKPATKSGLKALESVYVSYETIGNEVRFSYDDN